MEALAQEDFGKSLADRQEHVAYANKFKLRDIEKRICNSHVKLKPQHKKLYVKHGQIIEWQKIAIYFYELL